MRKREFNLAAACLVLATAHQRLAAKEGATADRLSSFLMLERAIVLNPTQMYSLSSDLFIRSYFADIHALPNWGADHPAWSRNLVSFTADMLALLLPEGSGLEAHLFRTITKQLSEQQLAALVKSVSAPEFKEATDKLSEVGMSWKNLVLIQMVLREPKFYSAFERKQAKELVAVWRTDPTIEQDAFKSALHPLVELLRSPTFLAYHAAIQDTFRSDAKRLGEQPEKKRGFGILMQSWHNRLKARA